MGRRLLTLAIALNAKNQSYDVICYDLHKERLIPLELEKTDIQGKNGIYFDIAAITEVEALRENEIIYPVGSKKIVERYSRKQLKQLFEKLYVNIERFIKSKEVNPYSIIKVSQITELGKKNSSNYGILPTISFYANGVIQKGILVNDYRWINYVRAIGEKSSKRLAEYKTLLNKKDQQVYLIMRRAEGAKEVKIYVVGIHYL